MQRIFLTTLIFILIGQLSFAIQSPSNKWAGPTQGPFAQSGRTIYFIASDLRNGGVSAVSESLLSAARVLKWNIQILDGAGKIETIRAQLNFAIQHRADGIVLGGFDDTDFPSEIQKARGLQIKMVGWHASASPGPTKALFSNITTDPLLVAKQAALLTQKFGAKNAGIIIFTDNRFSIARRKTAEMKKIVGTLPGYKVLEVIDLPLSDADIRVPKEVVLLNRKHGRAWTHTLAINDVYFDHINFPLINVNRKDIVNISAGDGSNKAINRIKSGISQQVATIAEPLRAQGWQIADEMNRAFSGAPDSGFVGDPLQVTKKIVGAGPEEDVEAQEEFQQAYRKIWHPSAFD